MQANLLPTHFEKTLGAMKAERTVSHLNAIQPTRLRPCTSACPSLMSMR